MQRIFNKLQMELPAEIASLLAEHPNIKVTENGMKLKCAWSGHEMKCQLRDVNSYINGKKYKRLKLQKIGDLDKYKQHLVPSTKKRTKHQLFCQLTWRHLNNEPHHILRHVEGRRFQKAILKWKDCQEKGIKYHPRSSNKTPEKDDIDNDTSEGENEVEDNLSDLYPDDLEEESMDTNEVHAGDTENSAPVAEKGSTTQKNTKQTSLRSKNAKKNLDNDVGNECLEEDASQSSDSPEESKKRKIAVSLGSKKKKLKTNMKKKKVKNFKKSAKN